jgi:hypothetical protein
MIPISELRIGIWVIASDKIIEEKNLPAPYYYKVNGVDIYKAQLAAGDTEQAMEPIALTAEILNEWCDFELEELENGKYYWKRSKNGGLFKFDVGKHGYYFSHWTDVVLFNSLHQLQNLYYALTGEELVVKVPVYQML